jgi:hypothetical protein
VERFLITIKKSIAIGVIRDFSTKKISSLDQERWEVFKRQHPTSALWEIRRERSFRNSQHSAPWHLNALTHASVYSLHFKSKLKENKFQKLLERPDTCPSIFAQLYNTTQQQRNKMMISIISIFMLSKVVLISASYSLSYYSNEATKILNAGLHFLLYVCCHNIL